MNRNGALPCYDWVANPETDFGVHDTVPRASIHVLKPRYAVAVSYVLLLTPIGSRAELTPVWRPQRARNAWVAAAVGSRLVYCARHVATLSASCMLQVVQSSYTRVLPE